MSSDFTSGSAMVWGSMIGMALNLVLLLGNGVVLTLMVMRIYRSVSQQGGKMRLSKTGDADTNIYDVPSSLKNQGMEMKNLTGKEMKDDPEGIYHLPSHPLMCARPSSGGNVNGNNGGYEEAKKPSPSANAYLEIKT